jgi:hypothetical protein
MRPRRLLQFGLVLVSLFLLRGQALACDVDGWVGTQFALRPAKLPGELGWQVGVLPLGLHVSDRQCLRIGPGVELTYADGFHAAVLARLSLGGRDGFFSRQLYLQAGPMVGGNHLGLDVEAGLDWGVAALFVASKLFEDSGESAASTFTVGIRFSLASPILFIVAMGLAAS